MYDTGVVRLECNVTETKSPPDLDVDKTDLQIIYQRPACASMRRRGRVHSSIDHGSDKGAIHQAFPAEMRDVVDRGW